MKERKIDRKKMKEKTIYTRLPLLKEKACMQERKRERKIERKSSIHTFPGKKEWQKEGKKEGNAKPTNDIVIMLDKSLTFGL